MTNAEISKAPEDLKDVPRHGVQQDSYFSVMPLKISPKYSS